MSRRLYISSPEDLDRLIRENFGISHIEILDCLIEEEIKRNVDLLANASIAPAGSPEKMAAEKIFSRIAGIKYLASILDETLNEDVEDES